jgi:digeranylgeranylglycerophospholipid reductase
MKYDIIIIGAGIAGLSAAKAIAKNSSLSVGILEHKSIGSSNPSPLTFFDTLENFGLTSCIKGSYSNFDFHNYRGSLIKYRFGRSPLVVLDYKKACLRLCESLRESKNEPVLISNRATGLSPEDGCVYVTLADESRLEAKLVIDCSGKSQLAASQFEKNRFSYYSHVYGAVFSGVKNEGDGTCCFLWPTEEFGLGGGWFYSLGEGSASFGYASISDSPDADSKQLKEKFNAALKAFEPYSGYLENADIEYLEFGTIPITYIKRFVYDGVVIVGDAAGMATNWTCMGVEPALKYGKLAGELSMKSIQKNDPGLLNEFQVLWERDNKDIHDRMAKNAAKFWVSDFYLWEWIIKNDLARLSPDQVLERMRYNSNLPKMHQLLSRIVIFKLKSILDKNTIKPLEITIEKDKNE